MRINENANRNLHDHIGVVIKSCEGAKVLRINVKFFHEVLSHDARRDFENVFIEYEKNTYAPNDPSVIAIFF